MHCRRGIFAVCSPQFRSQENLLQNDLKWETRARVTTPIGADHWGQSAGYHLSQPEGWCPCGEPDQHPGFPCSNHCSRCGVRNWAHSVAGTGIPCSRADWTLVKWRLCDLPLLQLCGWERADQLFLRAGTRCAQNKVAAALRAATVKRMLGNPLAESVAREEPARTPKPIKTVAETKQIGATAPRRAATGAPTPAVGTAAGAVVGGSAAGPARSVGHSSALRRALKRPGQLFASNPPRASQRQAELKRSALVHPQTS